MKYLEIDLSKVISTLVFIKVKDDFNIKKLSTQDLKKLLTEATESFDSGCWEDKNDFDIQTVKEVTQEVTQEVAEEYEIFDYTI